MKDSKVIILILVVVGVILLVLWLNSCEKYSSHMFPGPRSNYHSGHSLHVGRGIYDWSKVSGYEQCVKNMIKQQYLTFKEADQLCTPLLSDPEVEEFPI